MMQLRRSILATSLLLTTTLFAATMAQPDFATELQPVVDTWQRENDVLGVSVSLASPLQGRVDVVSGRATLEQALTPDTPMYVGSITKSFIAAAALQLVDEGLLSLDDTLDRWYPDFPNAAQITVAHLLTMTSGTYDYFRNAPDNAFLPLALADISRQWDADEIISTVAEFVPVATPGTSFDYSNTNYLMLGEIITEVTGQSVEDVLQTRFLTVLGLEDSYLAGSQPHADNLAGGYLRGSTALFGHSEPMLAQADDYAGLETLSRSAGNLVSTSHDLATWLIAVTQGDILSPTMTHLMLAPTELSLQVNDGYGYGLEWVDTAYGQAVGHSGSIPGYASLILFFPQLDITISATTNDEQGEAVLLELVENVVAEVVGSYP
ncbi:MAG: serine hydrolase domain-containing protein [Deinococcota bacterium]